MSDPILAVYLQLAPALKAGNALDAARQAKDAGYNTIIAWDSPHQFTPQDPALEKQSRVFADGVYILGLDLWVQTAATNLRVRDALGAGAMETGTNEDDLVCCLADPRVPILWKWWAERAGQWYPHLSGVLLSYDEMRAQGTHPACHRWFRRYGGFGRLLARHAHHAIAMHRKSLGVPVAVWSDMFDSTPAGNAAPGDYVGDYPDHKWRVPGGWSGSWGGLDAETLVINWSYDLRSFQWFAGRGHKQMLAGYYDFGANDYGDGRSPEQERALMEAAVDSGVRISGYSYTTWQNDFSRLTDYLPTPDVRARLVAAAGGDG